MADPKKKEPEPEIEAEPTTPSTRPYARPLDIYKTFTDLYQPPPEFSAEREPLRPITASRSMQGRR
jgi:hypothetical protein